MIYYILHTLVLLAYTFLEFFYVSIAIGLIALLYMDTTILPDRQARLEALAMDVWNKYTDKLAVLWLLAYYLPCPVGG